MATEHINFQVAAEGFGSYLNGILPNDVAVAAGAFGASMQQIRNILSIPIEKFAQVVVNLETIQGLTVNGTDVPTDTALAQEGYDLMALGSGPHGTYTMSNFFGCMSGLPYDWKNIQDNLSILPNSSGQAANPTPGSLTLYEIYSELYLAVSWEVATASVAYTGSGPYTITSPLTITDSGGGYGRGSTAAPTVTIAGTSGLTVTSVIGTDNTNLSTFGKVTSITVTGTSPTPPSGVTIANPSTTYGSAGWPGMDAVIQYYIDAANTELAYIRTKYPGISTQLNTIWDSAGTQLNIEQRARVIGLPNIGTGVDRDPYISQYPTAQISFTDTIPRYAVRTEPHLYAQTLEAISDFNTLGGQSIVAMMREERNKIRLGTIGIGLDDNISDTLTDEQTSELIANGTLSDAVTGTGVVVDGVEFTIPANLLGTDPYGIYDPISENYLIDGQPVGTGDAVAPGSLAGSPYQKLILPNLNNIYASRILLPSVPTIQQAIDDVIRCNCDCWEIL
jgi:hypothetical protein